MKNNQEKLPRVVSFYFGVAKYLLAAMPLLAGILILGGYIADIYSGRGDCSFTTSALDFLGTAVRWYAGVLVVVMLTIPRIVFRRPPPGG